MKLYFYKWENEKLEEAEAEGVEKPKTFKTDGRAFPLVMVSVVNKDNLNMVDSHGVYVSTEPAKEKAVEAFKEVYRTKAERFRDKQEIAERNYEALVKLGDSL